MKEADAIYVLDTGSTDNTVELLQANGVQVTTKIINPWRFDIARNESLQLVPDDTDICVCTDLDEIFEPGWRKAIEEVWQEDTTRLAYNYNWSLDENNKPLVNFYIEKIHARQNYKWTHPVHEVLSYIGDKKEKKITTDKITVNHYPDNTKSRNSYLPLLELSVKEDPDDDRNMHYLGREYMYYGENEKAIDTLIKHLQLPRATWKDERCASMRFIARCYTRLKRYNEAKLWLKKARDEASYLRDPFIESALLAYQLQEWENVIHYVMKALQIKQHMKTYINEPFSWDATPYDLLSISFYQLDEIEASQTFLLKALKIDPNNERLQNNLTIIKQKLNDIAT